LSELKRSLPEPDPQSLVLHAPDTIDGLLPAIGLAFDEPIDRSRQRWSEHVGMLKSAAALGEVLQIEGAVILANNPDSTTASQVVGATSLVLALVGYIGGELLNHQIHWSGGRWGLVFLSAFLGVGLGGLLAAVTSTVCFISPTSSCKSSVCR